MLETGCLAAVTLALPEGGARSRVRAADCGRSTVGCKRSNAANSRFRFELTDHVNVLGIPMIVRSACYPQGNCPTREYCAR